MAEHHIMIFELDEAKTRLLPVLLLFGRLALNIMRTANKLSTNYLDIFM